MRRNLQEDHGPAGRRETIVGKVMRDVSSPRKVLMKVESQNWQTIPHSQREGREEVKA